MSEVNFGELLSVQVESVVRPPVFPPGHYLSTILSHKLDTSSVKGTPYCEFEVKLISPQEDVDEDLFEAAGGQEALDKKNAVNYKFYLTPDAFYRLREFLDDGLKLNVSGRNFDELLPEAENCQFLAKIILTPQKKEGEFWMNIDDYAAVE